MHHGPHNCDLPVVCFLPLNIYVRQKIQEYIDREYEREREARCYYISQIFRAAIFNYTQQKEIKFCKNRIDRALQLGNGKEYVLKSNRYDLFDGAFYLIKTLNELEYPKNMCKGDYWPTINRLQYVKQMYKTTFMPISMRELWWPYLRDTRKLNNYRVHEFHRYKNKNCSYDKQIFNIYGKNFCCKSCHKYLRS